MLEQDVVLFIVVVIVKGTIPAVTMQLSEHISHCDRLKKDCSKGSAQTYT